MIATSPVPTEEVGSHDYLTAAGDHAALYQGRIEPNYNQQQWINHPYWEDEDLHQGTVSFGGVLYPEVLLRYDILKNYLVVVTPVAHLTVVPDQSLIDYFTIGGQYFVPYDGRFYCIGYGGQQATMLYTRLKAQGMDVIEGTKAYHTLNTHHRFLLFTQSGVFEAESLRDVTKAFPTYKKELKNFAHSQHLKWRKDSQIQSSLIALAQHLDGLLQRDGATSANGTLLPPRPLTAAEEKPVTVKAIGTTSLGLSRDIPAYWAYLQGRKGNYTDYEEDEAGDATGVQSLDVIQEQHILDEVEVTGFQQKVGAGQVGMEKFRPALLKNIPLAMGEADVMKMVQTLPGVKTMGEASSGFNVRGGASDQNLILLNNNTVFNPMHLFGLFSAFNSDVVGETELYKSGIPSQYGGRISSVMNINSRPANLREWHGSASIGLLTSKAMLDAPIVKDRASLLLGGRSTYSDWMLGLIPEKSGYRDGKAGFWDVSASLNVVANEQNRLNVYGYYSRDRFSFTSYDGYAYSNTNASIEWKSRPNEQLSWTAVAGYDHYEYQNEDKSNEYSAARLSFGISQYFAKALANYRLNDQHSLQAGVHGQYYDILPGEYEPIGEISCISHRKLDKDPALELSVWAEDQWKVLPQLTLTGGLRYTLFKSMHENKEKAYQAPEIRLALSYKLTENQSLKAGYNTMHQFIHKVSNTSIMSPTDTWILSNDKIKPQEGYQVAAGYYLQTPNHKFEVTVEGYYKEMKNYLTYRSAGQLVMNSAIEHEVAATQGRAYGIELQLRKPTGKLNGWISYSYSRTQLRQNEADQYGSQINGGDWFAAEYDRPHELKLVSNYRFTRRYSMSANVDYSTGRPITVPVGQFYSYAQQRLLPLYADRNSYRIPDYCRVDWSFNIEPSHHLTNLTHSWFSIGVYNLFGRRNAYSIYYEAQANKIQGYKLSIFGVPIPFVNYNIKF